MSFIDSLKQRNNQEATDIFASWAEHIIIVGCVAFGEIHNASLFFRGLPKGWEVPAGIGVFSLGASILTLHFFGGAFAKNKAMHWASLAVFWLDLMLMFINVVVDYATNEGNSSQLPDWANTYRMLLLPGCPILIMVGWSVIRQLSPKYKQAIQNSLISAEEDNLEAELRVNTRVAYLQSRINLAVSNQQYRAMIDSAAERDQFEQGRNLLGAGFQITMPVKQETKKVLSVPSVTKNVTVGKPAQQEQPPRRFFSFNMAKPKQPTQTVPLKVVRSEESAADGSGESLPPENFK